MKITLVSILLIVLTGCEGVLSPIGPIGQDERTIMLDALAIMLAIAIPTIIGTLVFAWWFRASNTRASYLPDWSYSGRVEILVWAIPTLVILFLGGITWISSHDLDPAHPIDSQVKPLEIEVVSLDWKWLFIYPEQHIASINRLVLPADVPLHFSITSASVFNVFFIPRLGSQIYAMNGMVTQLNLQADKLGNYFGLSGNFSGDGFSGMSFDVRVVPAQEFSAWITTAQKGEGVLDAAGYRALLKQSENVKPYTYNTVDPGLFNAIVMHKLPQGEGPPNQPGPATSLRKEK